MMTSRRSTVTLIGAGAAAALSGALVVAAVAVDSGQGAAGQTTASYGQATSVRSDVNQYRNFYRTHPGGRSPYPRHLSHCVISADSAQHWIDATGHLPCNPFADRK
jgi:hypothetical protein